MESQDKIIQWFAEGLSLKTQIRFVTHASSHIIINSNANFGTNDEKELELKTKQLESEILHGLKLLSLFKESISINRAIVERLKREDKDYFSMEKSVIADERLLEESKI